MKKAYGWIALFLLLGSVIPFGVWLSLVPCVRCVLTPRTVHPDPSPGQERAQPHSLKALAAIEAYFRAEDVDKNGVKDFWRKDVAGLYVSFPAAFRGERLMPQNLALADRNPAVDLSAVGSPQPLRGYWYRSIIHEDEDPNNLDPQRFAFAAIPVDFPKHQKYTFIIDENNTVFRSDLPENRNVTVFPKNLAAKGWSKLD